MKEKDLLLPMEMYFYSNPSKLEQELSIQSKLTLS